MIVNGFDYTKSECPLICGMCPMNDDPAKGRWCPNWIKTVEENAAGEARIAEGCLSHELPRFLIQVIRASNRPAAAFEKARNAVAGRLEKALPEFFGGLKRELDAGEQPMAIQDKRDGGES
jgi:hypothetical protein